MSSPDAYADDAELADFIVDDDATGPEGSRDPRLAPPPSGRFAPENNGTLPFTAPHGGSDGPALPGLPGAPATPDPRRLLRAHISILVSALGGPDHSAQNGAYKLGHDALACLKDLKRWLRAVDEKNGTADVALACADCDLVRNDLVVILCQGDRPHKGTVRLRAAEKILLACLELLVLLTWPTDVTRDTPMADYTARTSVRRAQVAYKHHVLTYRQGRTLKAVLRLGLGALRVPKAEREPRDLAILRLILYFIRNMLYIEPLPATRGPQTVGNASALPAGVGADEIALPAVVQAFERNNVLLFLNSIAHSVLRDISDETFGLLAMECLCLLTRGVRVADLTPFAAPAPAVPNCAEAVPPASAVAGMDLSALLGEELRRQKHARNAMLTRHGRFGTLLSLRNLGNASYFAVSGQKALASTYDTLEKLDSAKSWHRPSAFRYDSNAYVRSPPAPLGAAAAALLARFVGQLLASGSFNNLLTFVGRHLTNLANDRDAGRRGILDAVDPMELSSYFLTMAWFFRFKRERTQAFAAAHTQPAPDEDGVDYGSVGAALSETNFILLISYLRLAFEAKDHDSLHVAMLCFREMLLLSNSVFTKKRTQQELDLVSADDIDEDRELAEGIIRKLFSQKQFLDMCVNIPKTAAKHSPEYLGVVVSVVHILLKSFEALANEDVHLFIKTRRKMRKMERPPGLNHEMDQQHWDLIDRGSDEEEDQDQIRYITQERKLDLRSIEVKFFHPETVSTHIEYLSKYEDLTSEEIKRGLSFFHRLFVVRKDYSALYRMDFMLILYKLQAYLPRSSSNSRHVNDFIVYFMKKFKVALDRFPTAIEVLFPRLENLELKGFLNTGDLQVLEKLSKTNPGGAANKNSYFDEDAVQPRAAPLVQFNDESLSLDEKIGILVYHLSKRKNTTAFMKYFATEMLRISEITPGQRETVTLRLNLAKRRLLISDPHLRLLLETIGFGLPYLQNDETTLHESVTAELLKDAVESLNKWLSLHEGGVGDIEPFLDQFQRMFFSKEQLDFGAQSLADLRAGKSFDDAKAAELELDERHIHKVIGLAKRREYDENVSSRFYEDDEFEDQSSNSASDDEEVQKNVRKRKRSRRQIDSGHEMSLPDDDVPSLRRRKGERSVPREVFSDDEVAATKSAELVHDSDDDSDEERNTAFFEKEEKLRQLISLTGGISSKEQLSLFKESWTTILKSGSGDRVNEAMKMASSLFVEDLDDEELSLTRKPFQTRSRNKKLQSDDENENHVPRKRRAIIDDDDDE
ncbi:timeless-domain-containing protein [Metschnikowia bicuspidata var. bicuspidata NRRL YB-4993]|uniref:Topoisomerase 1-associated factor 1 n=1 Tax=Metschnikowia bicuspidata var. bicuspidata NRRL YB-4993 TaxID=869754 RepID=A0A1A0HFY4_9ASCO|nr:timeless-domain-containing protein [Metschnikowia bicuspidata var. bicuspidata NRRL YB-4993]OBA22807.1 timeless-domain-containing protein [Metschnikowia bicuspidata var. bicuspidata NRRL YB-4993]